MPLGRQRSMCFGGVSADVEDSAPGSQLHMSLDVILEKASVLGTVGLMPGESCTPKHPEEKAHTSPRTSPADAPWEKASTGGPGTTSSHTPGH